MLFHSYAFLFFFLPIVLGGYLWLRHVAQYRLALGWLVLASFFFYAWWHPPSLLLLLSSIVCNYGVSRWLTWTANGRLRTTLLAAGLVFNVVLLGYFKYIGFVTDIWNGIFGTSLTAPAPFLPLAISFFTFQQIAYLVDTWKRRVVERDFLSYCLFVSFFPQLIAGPIVHHSEMMPQFRRIATLRISKTKMAVGLSLIGIGLFKKVILADHLASYFHIADKAIADGYQLTLIEAWSAISAASIQIYFDFSAYSDMALGLGLLFGISLPLNFNSPFKASSMAEFWRRWNITLMRFFRDYIYIPLGGSHKGLHWQMGAIGITLLISGVWHGSGLNFVVWGAMHGAILATTVAWLRATDGMRWRNQLWATVAGRAVTFVSFVTPMALFMFSDIRTGLNVLGAMFGANGIALPPTYVAYLGLLANPFANLGVQFVDMPGFLGIEEVIWLVAALAIIYGLPSCYELFRHYLPGVQQLSENDAVRTGLIIRWRPSLAWSIAVGAMIAASLMGMNELKEFFYFQF